MRLVHGRISVRHARTRAGILVGLVFVRGPSLFGGEVRAVVPAAAPAPVGPYTPGIDTGDYLYVSGQGAAAPNGTMASGFEDQVRQTLENVKAIVEAAGLTMEHVVYTQVYLEDMAKFGEMNRVYARFFPKAPPARATLGVARLPGTPVEVNAVAVRNLSHKKTVSVPGYEPGEPVTPGILTHDRLFVSAMRGRDLATGAVPPDAATQVDRALDGMKAVVEAAGLTMSHLVFVNPYLTTRVPMDVMNERTSRRPIRPGRPCSRSSPGLARPMERVAFRRWNKSR
jgi:2-iminobutanoate/2-iminopropanoate deaminase